MSNMFQDQILVATFHRNHAIEFTPGYAGVDRDGERFSPQGSLPFPV